MLRRVFTGSVFALAALGARSVRAQSSAIVLALPASARAASAGDAAPFATDASALFYGAQHLPETRAVTASGGTWVGDATLATVAFSTPVRWRRWAPSVLALGVQALDYGNADEMVPDPLTGGTRGTPTGSTVSGNEVAISAGMGQRFGRQRAGWALTYVRQTVADLSASALTMSGAAGVTIGHWDVDLSSEHVTLGGRNPARRTLTLPSTTRFSVATPVVSMADFDWRGVGEIRRTNGEGTTSLVGLEGEYETDAGWVLDLRAAGLTYSDETTRAPWSVGGSAARGAWSFDYAYQGFGALGAVHRMGVTWRSRDRRNPSR